MAAVTISKIPLVNIDLSTEFDFFTDNLTESTVSDLPETHEDEESILWPAIAGASAWFALFLSIWGVCQHLANYTKPYLQKYIIRILWMVPIYGFNAWLGIKFPGSAMYMDTLRECYEAFVIYSFMKYLLNFLYDETDSDILIQCKPPQKHLFPLCWLEPLPGGYRFLNNIKQGILQYAVVRPITTLIALISEVTGVYGEGEWSLSYSFIYLFIINNLSQMIAMYCLVVFYQAYKNELSPMNPLGKFMSIKCIIFFSFFQSVLLSILISWGIITRGFTVDSTHDEVDIQRNVQDFLICLEMLIAAFAHVYVFSHRPFIDTNATVSHESGAIVNSFFRVIDFTDERSDLNDHFRQVYKKGKNTVMGRRKSDFEFDDDDDSCTTLIPLRPTNSQRQSNQFYSTC